MQRNGTRNEASPSVQRWTLIATILASGIVFLDRTVVNVALPSIGRELEIGLSGLQRILNKTLTSV